MALRPEASELSGLALDCPGACAYCCLCPPGLLDGEVDGIVSACEDCASALGKDRIGDSEHAVQVQGGRGACAFLADRRCKVYEARPHFCRQYPVMVYAGWRLQLSAIRSCRGLVKAGASKKARPLMDLFRGEVEAKGEDYYAETLEDTKSCFEDIKDSKELYAPPAEVRKAAMRAANAMGDARALCKVVGNDIHDEGKARIAALEMFWDDIESAFTCPEVIDLPVYNRPDRNWEVFRVVGGGEMSAYQLMEDGNLVYNLSKPAADLKLRPLDSEAKGYLKQYLQLAFDRDVFYGRVARDAIIAEQPMKELAAEIGASITTDLWWRACMLTTFGAMAHPEKAIALTGPLGIKSAKEAVIFMDADLLDALALGAII